MRRLAAACARAGELEQGQEQLRLLSVQMAETELAAGEAFERAGDLVSAEERYSRAARLAAPKDPAPFEARARLRERRGDTRGALDDRVEADMRRSRGSE